MANKKEPPQMSISKLRFWPGGLCFPFSYNSHQTRYHQGKPKVCDLGICDSAYCGFMSSSSSNQGWVTEHRNQQQQKRLHSHWKEELLGLSGQQKGKSPSWRQKMRLFLFLIYLQSATLLRFLTTWTLSAQGNQNKLAAVKSARQINPSKWPVW